MNVMIECRKNNFEETIAALKRKGFRHDEAYGPIPMPDKDTVIIRGSVDQDKITDLQEILDIEIERVWSDPKIEPFGPVQR